MLDYTQKLLHRIDKAWEMVQQLHSDIVLSEFELHSRHYIHFRTNTPGKNMI